MDFLVHCIGFADRNELKGRYVDTSRANFQRALTISAFSFTELSLRASSLMTSGGSLLTLTYGGSTRVMPNYNVMGVAKAALEASVRYLASDFGPVGIRVNAISAGPIRTLAGPGLATRVQCSIISGIIRRYARAFPLRKSEALLCICYPIFVGE